MTVKNLIDELSKKLCDGGIENSGFESRCIVASLLGVRNSALRLKQNNEIADETVSLAEKAAARRLGGEPLQYITGSWDFYESEFFVGEGVLIPRPETEELVELALESIAEDAAETVVDLCAGSGCIGISIAKKRPGCRVIMIEKSPEAAKYAKKNLQKEGLSNCSLLLADMFDCDFPGSIDVLVSNPPYIASAEIETLQREVQNEPRMALDGGEDGLMFYRAICEKWLPRLSQKGRVFIECGEEQARIIADLFNENNMKSRVISDSFGTERFTEGRK